MSNIRKHLFNILFYLTMWPTIQLFLLFVIADIWLRRRDDTNTFWRVTGYLYAWVIFIPLDVFYDITVASLYFQAMPEWRHRDKTFTARLKYYQRLDLPGRKWRAEKAKKLCVYINKIDPGHC